jgi:hypothetical protein
MKGRIRKMCKEYLDETFLISCFYWTETSDLIMIHKTTMQKSAILD